MICLKPPPWLWPWPWHALLLPVFSSSLPCGQAFLNTDEEALLQGDVKIPLSRNEYRILRLLLEQHGHIVSRDAIMTALWESDSFVDENTLSVNVNRLRRKLESAGVRDLIQTRKGVGYLVE